MRPRCPAGWSKLAGMPVGARLMLPAPDFSENTYQPGAGSTTGTDVSGALLDLLALEAVGVS